jgi:hypothetical protein
MSQYKGFFEKKGRILFVGARSTNKERGEYSYDGPTAEVYRDKDFFYISTDPCEGTAMLNIESLPFLIKALREIKKELKNEQGGS